MKYRVPHKIPIGGVKLVWYSKTLQNKKAIVITSPFDGKFYEVTYNGDKEEMYVDQYEKRLNMKLTRSELDRHHEETNVFREAFEERTQDPFVQDITNAINEMREVVAKRRKEIEQGRKG